MANSYRENSAVNALDFKQSVRAATTANITLSGTQTIDGVGVVAGDRVLVKDQTTGSGNGIYVAAAGAWARALDCNESAEVTPNFMVFVEEGTANADTGWMLTTNAPITLGSTSLAFSKFAERSSAVSITGGSINGATVGATTASTGKFTQLDVDNVRIDANTVSATNTNGALIVSPNGTGALQADGSGNARGQYAVDLQRIRLDSAAVASGMYSAILSPGQSNTASGNYSVVSGGDNNTASGTHSTVFFGKGNASSGFVSVAGGYYNNASGYISTVGGGRYNTASGSDSAVGGGRSNTSSDYYSTVGGGYGNKAIENMATTVAGGYFNTASGEFGTVGGGQSNTASDTSSTVGGGQSNNASGFSSTVGGGNSNNASGSRSTVGGGNSNEASNFYSTVGGGGFNTSSNFYSTVGGGSRNNASGGTSTVGGGLSNTASSYHSTVGGGRQNTASNSYSTVGGGNSNEASATYSTVGGGSFNTSSGSYSTVSGGFSNTASGYTSTVSGGNFNTSSGTYSTISGGTRAVASLYGEKARSSGRFNIDGDAQTRKFILRNRTTSSTNINLYLDGFSQEIFIPENTSWFYTINIVARNADDVETAAYKFEGAIERSSLFALILGNTKTVVHEDNPNWDASLSIIDDSKLRISCSVGAGQNKVYWVAYANIVQVTVPSTVPSYS